MVRRCFGDELRGARRRHDSGASQLRSPQGWNEIVDYPVEFPRTSRAACSIDKAAQIWIVTAKQHRARRDNR